jgi:hypothetical protein
MFYKVIESTGTHGAVTKKPYKLIAGETVEAPEGEFVHLGDAVAVVTIPKDAPHIEVAMVTDTQTEKRAKGKRSK